MTIQEQKTINNLVDSINLLKNENDKFRIELNQRLKFVEDKVEQKEYPLTLEKEVIYSASNAIKDAMKTALSDSYSSPLKKYATNVIAKYQDAIENAFDKIVSEAISTNSIEDYCKDELMKKIARTVITGIDGSTDKVIAQLKQNSIFRSKLTIMVNTLVEEFIKTK